ncbi:M23 family metallopeptidase [Demequina aurantiaca]|uniref:M23 family metallopeptidase n=1 Tax=Demequina aurantiaca TaxID=676200 RepID=UPI003D3326EF
MELLLRYYRVRGVVSLAAIAALLIGAARPLVPAGALSDVLALLSLLGLVVALSLLATIPIAVRHLPVRDQISVTSPVTGRWLALNSPIDKVPSHGVRAYGQAYAIDVVYDPADQQRPMFGTGGAMRRPTEYPAFGRPVRAMIDGEVVTALDALRDHRARSTWLGVIYMMVEGAFRELGGPRFIIGNHITIRSDDGAYALVAHLQRGSSLVSKGERVRAGQTIAACGNSGNTSEPHVHAQLMDRRSAWTGQGVPIVFAGVQIGESNDLQDGLPSNSEYLIVE